MIIKEDINKSEMLENIDEVEDIVLKSSPRAINYKPGGSNLIIYNNL